MPFKKVFENEQIPDILSNAFLGLAPSVTEDRYASLSAGSEQRKARISRDTAGYDEDVTAPEVSGWEVVRKADTYRQPRMSPTTDDVDYNSYFTEDVSGRSVNRISTAQDDGVVTRDTLFKECVGGGPVTRQDAEYLLSRGATLFDPRLAQLQEMLLDGMDEDAKMRNPGVARARRQADAHNEWESKAMRQAMRPTLARAHSIVRASAETVSAGREMLPMTQDALDAHEAERIEMHKNRLKREHSIKRVGQKSRKERHDDWEASHSVDSHSDSPDWVDAILNRG